MCGGWKKADYCRLRDPDRRKISGLSISFCYFHDVVQSPFLALR